MEKLITRLKQDYPKLIFKQSLVASWSPKTKEICYKPSRKVSNSWSVLHEVGHAVLGHNSYGSDIELLQKELEAWNEARNIAKSYGLIIDDSHIENCLDTYRDWLHKRSTCPYCDKHGFQQSRGLYSCLNCEGTWKVSSERFCRPYRLKSEQK